MYCISLLAAISVLAYLHASVYAVESENGFVHTPGGVRSKSQVHHVPDGATVHHTPDAIHIISKNGEILHTAAVLETNPQSGVGMASRTFKRPSTVNPPRAISTGYVAYTYFTGNSDSNPISNFSSTWDVPAKPKTNHDQLLYLFSALTPASDDAILQPVLQYGTSGAGGGNYWATASWYLVGDQTYHTTLIPVTSGSSLSGIMTLQNTDIPSNGGNTTYTYNAQFTHSPYTTMTVNTTEPLNWAWQALEIYQAKALTDLPKGSTIFRDIDMTNLNGDSTPLQWIARNDSQDGFSAKILLDGPKSGKVAILY